MFFRLRTRLLIASAITLALLIALVALTALRIAALRPAISQLNQLNLLTLQTRDLTLRTQAASADLNIALTGIGGSLFQAQDFDNQLRLMGTVLAEMGQSSAAL